MRLLLTALALAVPLAPSFAGAVGDCPNGCANRESLYRLADAPPAGQGSIYENSRSYAGRQGGVAANAERGVPPATRFTAVPDAGATKAAVPSPSVEKEGEKKEDGGIMGFLGKHKWQIAGSVVGTVAGFLLGGGLLGALLGIGIGLAVSFLGPKIFSRKK